MSQEGSFHDDTQSSHESQDLEVNNTLESSGESNSASAQHPQSPPAASSYSQNIRNYNDESLSLSPDNVTPSSTSVTNELQRRRTEALERILLASDSNLSLPPQSPSPALTNRRLRLNGSRHLRGSQRCYLNNRNMHPRNELDRAIFIPFRARTSVSAMNLPSMSTEPQPQEVSRAVRNLIGNSTRNRGMLGDMNDNPRREESNGNGPNRPRVNVSTFFMELTYSTAEPNLGGFNPFKSSSETQKRKMEIHSANTMAFIKQYCPVKLQKLSQFRCCVKTQRPDFFNFKNTDVKPLDLLDPTQTKCYTKAIVIIRDECAVPGKTFNPFTSHIMSCMRKRNLNPTCLTFQSEACLTNYIEHLNSQIHAFPKQTNNIHDPKFTKQAKSFLVMSVLSRLVERWNVPILILDSCFSKITEMSSVLDFAKRFQIRVFDIEPDISSPTGGNSKQRKAAAKRVARQVKKAMVERNMIKIRNDLEKISAHLHSGAKEGKSEADYYSPRLISDDCRRIVFNLHERMSHSLQQQQSLNIQEKKELVVTDTPKISPLEDGILADIESSDAFKSQQQRQRDRDVLTPKSSSCRSGRKCVSRGTTTSTTTTSTDGRPRTGYSISDDEIQFPTRDQEKVSELLFNELNQRWRVHGPQRFIPKGTDAGPYCDPLMDSEKQLLLSVIQEVTNFEVLKDIRNELKDSKKDLEGRLYGYNPDFANLIASAEEFLHGKASCLEPCQEELDFYKMPVSLVYSEAEVRYMKMKPPLYVIGSESPSQVIRAAMEESTKLFLDAVIQTTCGVRPMPLSRRHKTKAIVVIEDNNEVLELLTVALWFFERTPLATFQAKFCHNAPEFLLSLDACRFYFGSYPVTSSKKDDEHLYERWLGLGMNGILRSFQSKILLIDFPRPGTNLQNSKNILFNRLKIEEKLHNIKSFNVGKPVRREDNLSTVENVLDEIQKCLEPRDKLLFRKARRMYLDLKLYKQIEQKSRQDLKSNRDWGIPEPDAEIEHGLCERLRNSEVVVNHMTVSPVDTVAFEHAVTFSNHDSESNAMTEDDDMSDTRSTDIQSVNCVHDRLHSSDEDYESTSQDVTVKTRTICPMSAQCEDGEEVELDDATLSSLSDHRQHQRFNEMLRYHSTKFASIAVNTDSIENIENCKENVEAESNIEKEDDCQSNDSFCEAYHEDFTLMHTSEVVDFETATDFSRTPSEYLVPFRDESSIFNCNKVEVDTSDGNPSDESTPRPNPHFNNAAGGNENQRLLPPLRRAKSFFNLIDGKLLREIVKANIKRRACSNVKKVNEGNLLDDYVDSQKYTRLEFTLAPKATSGESSCPSNSSFLMKMFTERAASTLTTNGDKINGKSSGEKIPRKSKSLHETCKAYLHKWGKSVSQILRKPKPRRIFPEQRILTSQGTPATINETFCHTTHSFLGAGDTSFSTELSSSSAQQRGNSRWLRPLTSIFRKKIPQSKIVKRTGKDGQD